MASVIARIDEPAFGPTPAEAAVTVGGEVETRAVIASPDRPLRLWLHRLRPGASLAWSQPRQDHLVYVWEGAVTVKRLTLGVDEAYVIEHGGRGEVRAGDQAATLLHFHRAEDHPQAPIRAGGHTHLLAGGAVRRGIDTRDRVGRSLFADAACPTCAVWLHGNQLPAGLKTDLHYHTEDEIIVVTAGQMKLGRLAYGRGSVLAIDAQTRYGFRCGDDGLSFINYRADPPTYVGSDTSRPPMDERALLLNGLAHSRPPAPAAAGV
jgi:quercetin dioxygenase-like cupin family protein